MGTTWSVRLICPEASADAAIAGLRRACQEALDRIVAQMSPWEPESVLCQFNRAPPGTWLHLPQDFAAVVAEAIAVAELSDGAFDPCIGTATEAWGFGALPVTELPDERDWAALATTERWRQLSFDRQNGRLRQPGGVTLDFCAIAKGYGVDKLAAILSDEGFASFLVEIGGELRARGIKPDGLPWWVEVEHPERTFSDLRVALTGCAIATSGNDRRYYEVNGQRLGHTMDPTTGTPSTNGVCSVTVIDATAMRADALATALMVLGPSAAAFARKHQIAARILVNDGTHIFEQLSPAMAEMIE
jgi:thiamine biosynthesis lipoprotein